MIAVNARFLTQPITGVQRFALEISRGLQLLCNKNEIKFFAPHNILQEAEANEFDVEIIGSHTGHLWEQFDLPQHLKKKGSPLLLNFCNTAPVFYSNKISTLHDITYIRFPKTYSIAFRLFYQAIIPRVLKSSKHVFTVSEFSKKEICNYYHLLDEKITVVHNAVNDSFHPQSNEKLTKENYLLAVSSVKESKNFEMIVKAFEGVSKEMGNLKLFIVGDLKSGSFSSINLDTLTSNPKIKLLGRVSDAELVELYSNAIAFLFPSLYEGFGIPVLEAQACHCPVIASNAASMPEVLANSADLVHPHNIDDWIQAIYNLVKNTEHRNQLIESGIRNISRFSWNQSANKVFNNIIEGMQK
ncbi:glycosyltransferase family 1 protein [Fibrobacter sp.]|uniref:glycosyltransferase family 4 protein n=1 Tax=Fibrobacter sp. TaxID=35828 RepID=UPI0025BBF815|nr:glycosyltransferase family 1 protein [Fibrobacter sp.]MBR3071706.1 glycosyltransferase family 4 protein [Fibrobacter sp.]